MPEVNTDQLKRYTGINLPDRKKLEQMNALGDNLYNKGLNGGLTFGAIGTLIMIVCFVYTSSTIYHVDISHFITALWICLAGFVACVVALFTGYNIDGKDYAAQYDMYFGTVYQGKVLERDTRGGGDRSLRWVVKLEGYTLANELIISWEVISAGEWANTKVGDYIEIDLPKALR